MSTRESSLRSPSMVDIPNKVKFLPYEVSKDDSCIYEGGKYSSGYISSSSSESTLLTTSDDTCNDTEIHLMNPFIYSRHIMNYPQPFADIKPLDVISFSKKGSFNPYCLSIVVNSHILPNIRGFNVSLIKDKLYILDARVIHDLNDVFDRSQTLSLRLLDDVLLKTDDSVHKCKLIRNPVLSMHYDDLVSSFSDFLEYERLSRRKFSIGRLKRTISNTLLEREVFPDALLRCYERFGIVNSKLKSVKCIDFFNGKLSKDDIFYPPVRVK